MTGKSYLEITEPNYNISGMIMSATRDQLVRCILVQLAKQ